MNVRNIAVATALAIAAVAVIALVASMQPNPRAQAHDDGTSHIHVTPTPTPLPHPGLNGPIGLDTSVVYDDGSRELVIVATINNPPPEGWGYNYANINVKAAHNNWELSAYRNGYGYQHVIGPHPPLRFYTDHLTVEIPLPDYADFNRLTEPVLARVEVTLAYKVEDPRSTSSEEIQLHEVLYFDLNDRDNWK